MRYNPDRHRRRSIRLQGYDYTQAGAYFVTACAAERAGLFGQIASGDMHPNAYGAISLECWQAIPDHCPHVELDTFLIMPNHIHGILMLKDAAARSMHLPAQERFGKPVAGSLPTIMRLFKAAVTRRINDLRAAPGALVWQHNYYEHIIRDQASLDRIRAYIVNNPLRWELDQLHPAHPSKW